jgi:flagellar export protein FliJ
MARDPIRILQMVRRLAVEQARHVLATCMAGEATAADRVHAIDEAARRDRQASEAVAEAYHFIDMFALRVQQAQVDRDAAEAALTQAQAASADARAVLVTARTAAESVETLIGERAEAAASDAGRREQHALDDMARSRFDSPLR